MLLPKWLAEPTLVSSDVSDGTPFSEVKHLLDSRILNALRSQGFENLFPIQVSLLTDLPKGDVCVAAPTGSGKTLSYLLPIVQGLRHRKVTCLRALIVVPGRELAEQVYSSLNPLAAPLGLEVGIATGQSSFSAEQKRIVGDPLATLVDGANGGFGVDILVATPGRLLDHLQQTVGFTVEHLQWLVLDEVDRLLEDAGLESSFLSPLLKATWAPPKQDQARPHLVTYRNPEDVPVESPFWITPVKKILLSATLTRNPAKLAELKLENPTFIKSISLQERSEPSLPIADEDSAPQPSQAILMEEDDEVNAIYETPKELKEYLHVSEEEKKPIALIYLLSIRKLTRALCFTGSVETVKRLKALLTRACPTSRIAAFTGELRAFERRELLKQFNEGGLDLLVCSDAAARGLDLQRAEAVINYDVPRHSQTYVHRVGRTARAGRPGTAYTIAAIREAHHFKQLLSKMGKTAKIPTLRIPKSALQEISPIYWAALEDS